MSMDDRVRRALLIVLLVTAQVGLAIYAGTTPGTIREGGLLQQVDGVEEYELLDADEVAFSLDIVAVDPVVGIASTPSGPQREGITGIESDVAVGDRIRLYGERQPDGQIRAKSMFVVPPSGLTYAYTVSLLAICWVGVRLLRDWHIDWAGPGILPRQQTEQKDA
jgi:hypothetical protein